MRRLAVRREMLSNEQRAPLCPAHVGELLAQRVGVMVQPSARRIFNDDEYRAAGATIAEDLADCAVVLGLKEVPADRLLENKVHAFFSHTIKGQAKNMPMLLHLMERGCTLIDYEKITDEEGRRLVFFGHYAGLAGMIDTLWALGRRLADEGVASPLQRLRSAYAYGRKEPALADIRQAGQELAHARLPAHLTPLVIGVAGDGNAARGAQKVLHELGARLLRPAELDQLPDGPGVYQVVFRERDIVEPRLGFFDPDTFDVQDYYRRPGRYRGVFERYLPYLNVLVNCIYWDERYPRLVSVEGLRQLFDLPHPRLKVIGDVSCDVRGAIEATVRATSPLDPVYVYDVETGAAIDGFAGNGPAVLAVYNLPSELPREASTAFSDAMRPFVMPIIDADYDVPFERCRLPEPLRRATIVYRGELTPGYQYLSRYL